MVSCVSVVADPELGPWLVWNPSWLIGLAAGGGGGAWIAGVQPAELLAGLMLVIGELHVVGAQRFAGRWSPWGRGLWGDYGLMGLPKGK